MFFSSSTTRTVTGTPASSSLLVSVMGALFITTRAISTTRGRPGQRWIGAATRGPQSPREVASPLTDPRDMRPPMRLLLCSFLLLVACETTGAKSAATLTYTEDAHKAYKEALQAFED